MAADEKASVVDLSNFLPQIIKVKYFCYLGLSLKLSYDKARYLFDVFDARCLFPSMQLLYKKLNYYKRIYF